MDESSAFDLSAQNSAMAGVGEMGREVREHNQTVKDSFKTQFAIDAAQHSAAELKNEAGDVGEVLGAGKGAYTLGKNYMLARDTRNVKAGQNTLSRLYEMQPEIAAKNIRELKNKVTQAATGEGGTERSIGGIEDTRGVGAWNEETGLNFPSGAQISNKISQATEVGRSGVAAAGGVVKDAVVSAANRFKAEPLLAKSGIFGEQARNNALFAEATDARAAAGAAAAPTATGGAAAAPAEAAPRVPGTLRPAPPSEPPPAYDNTVPRAPRVPGTLRPAPPSEPPPAYDNTVPRAPAEPTPAKPPPIEAATAEAGTAEAGTAEAGTVVKDATEVGKDAKTILPVASDTEKLAGNLLRGASKFSAGVGIAGGVVSAGSSVFTGIEDIFDKGYFSKLNDEQKIGNVSGIIGGGLDAASLVVPVLAPLAIGVNIFSAIEKTMGEHKAGDPKAKADKIKEESQEETSPGGIQTLSSMGQVSSAPVDIHQSISGTSSF